MIRSNLIGKENRLLGYTVQQLQKNIDRNAAKDSSLPGSTVLSSKPTRNMSQGTVAKEMPSTNDPLRVTSGYSPSTITVSTPGGDVGYDAANFTPVLDANGIVTGVTPKDTKSTTTVPKNAPGGYVDVNGLSPYSGEGRAGVAETPQEFEARKAAVEQRNAALMQQSLLKQQSANDIAGKNAASGAASAAAANQNVSNPTTGQTYSGAAGQRLQGRLDRQGFIEQKRAEGMTDAQIRDQIATLPPEQTGGMSSPQDTSTASPDAPGSTGTSPTTPTATKEEGKTTSDPNAAPTINPDSNLLRNIANTVEDPLLKSILIAEADRADASLSTNPDQTYDQFANSADGKALAQPYDAIAEILQKADKRATNTFGDQKEFLQNQYDRNEKLMALKEASIKDQLSFSNNKAVRDQADANKKKLDSETIMLALQGGFGSADGNREIADARLQGEQAIIDLNKEFGFKKTDVSLAFTEMHNEAFDKYRTSWLNALDNFESKVADLDIDGIANQQAKGSALGGAYKDYVSEIKEGRKEYAKTISEGTKMVYSAINTERDDKRAQEQLGWDRMDWAAKTYGSDTPQAIIDSIAKQLPGVDVANALSNMTLAEMKQFKIKSGGSSGSGGGGSFGSYVAGAPGTQSSTPFAEVTPGQLREAVDRITLSFGGTGAERNRKRGEYLDRIASGESTASIMASMQSDYWVTQTGAEKTAHDGRIDAQSSAEALQSFVDFYGINGDSDGSLGQVDSRVEWAKSFFGQSSEEYNNMADYVGNIRAKIIKENYGAAVTPQELEIARSYVPDMTDHGAKFVTKLQNLKAYNAYLDAKQFASNVGLPMPKPPAPVSLTGGAVTGSGKYSSDDITSALRD